MMRVQLMRGPFTVGNHYRVRRYFRYVQCTSSDQLIHIEYIIDFGFLFYNQLNFYINNDKKNCFSYASNVHIKFPK